MSSAGENKPLTWITGANGLIGNYLVQTAPRFAPRWRVRALKRADFDLLDFAAVERDFAKDRPQLVIHCAAISTIAEAQKNPGLARRVNVEVTKYLAELAAECSGDSVERRKLSEADNGGFLPKAATQFVFFSTDLVFDGCKGNCTETDATNPLHVYGETKVAAEKFILKNPRHLVVRTSINGGTSPSGNRAFNEQLRRSLRAAGQGMTLFKDEFRNPIPAVETARAVWELVQKNCAGLYHVAGAEKLSRLQIGELLVKRWPEITTPIKSGLAKDFPGSPRALDTSLDISKVQRVLSQPLPKFSDWLAKHPQEKF